MSDPKIHLKKRVEIPIYGAKLWVVVADNIKEARHTLNRVLGTCEIDLSGVYGLCSRNGSRFAVFFDKKSITMDLLAHEVFHLTHDIMQWANCNFDLDHSEQGALLHGYLMELVHKEVMKVKT